VWEVEVPLDTPVEESVVVPAAVDAVGSVVVGLIVDPVVLVEPSVVVVLGSVLVVVDVVGSVVVVVVVVDVVGSEVVVVVVLVEPDVAVVVVAVAVAVAVVAVVVVVVAVSDVDVVGAVLTATVSPSAADAAPAGMTSAAAASSDAAPRSRQASNQDVEPERAIGRPQLLLDRMCPIAARPVIPASPRPQGRTCENPACTTAAAMIDGVARTPNRCSGLTLQSTTEKAARPSGVRLRPDHFQRPGRSRLRVSAGLSPASLTKRTGRASRHATEHTTPAPSSPIEPPVIRSAVLGCAVMVVGRPGAGDPWPHPGPPYDHSVDSGANRSAPEAGHEAVR
jgi:hypothetical protein